MKRPRSHELETISRNKFRSVLPAAWIVREQTPDYGLDEQVQIVEGGLVTPLIFFVQLKATESRNGADHYPFPTDRLRYYSSLHSPVMLAVHDVPTDTLRYSWVHRFAMSLDRAAAAAWLLQDSATLNLPHVLGPESHAEVSSAVEEFYADLRKGTGDLPAIAVLAPQPSDDQSVKEVMRRLAGTRSRLSLVATESANVQVTLSPPSVRASSGSVSTEIVLPDKNASIPDAAMAALVVVLAQKNWTQQSIDILTELLSSDRPLPSVIERHLFVSGLTFSYASGGQLEAALDLASRALDVGSSNLATSLATAPLLRSQPSRRLEEKYEAFLRRAKDTVQAGAPRAAAFYSLANRLRAKGDLTAAFKFYAKAARESPAYRDKHYWWQETGGCLFLLGHFRFSERFYRRALEKSASPLEHIRPLLADAILHQGQYQRARDELNVYLSEARPPMAEAILYHALATGLAATVPAAPRRTDECAQKIEDALAAEPSARKELLGQALAADPLSPLANFNMGSSLAEEGNYSGAAWYYLVAGLLVPQDLEAWANVCGLAAAFKDEVLATAALARAFWLHGSFLEPVLVEGFVEKGVPREQALRRVRLLLELGRKCEAAFAMPPDRYLRLPALGDDDGPDLVLFSMPRPSIRPQDSGPISETDQLYITSLTQIGGRHQKSTVFEASHLACEATGSLRHEAPGETPAMYLELLPSTWRLRAQRQPLLPGYRRYCLIRPLSL